MRFIPLLITVFIDSLGFGLVYPIFSPLILSLEQSFLPLETSVATRGFLFGLLVSAFCIGQFFGGPVLGALSDRKGRKRILIASLWLSVVAYLLAGMGVILESIALLLLGRLLSGWGASNWSIAQSIIADQSGEEEKAKNFGLLGMAWGTGFVIGPFMGGQLSNPAVNGGIGLSTAFWVAAALCFLNVLLLRKSLEDAPPANRNAKLSLGAGFAHLKKAFTTPKLRSVFSVMFIFCLGWGIFTEFAPIFLIRHMHFELNEIANFYAWIGLWIALSQGIFIRPFVKRLSPEQLLPSALIGMAVVLPLLLLVHEPWPLFALLPFVAFFESLIFPSAATIVSTLSSKENQGEIFGIHNSVQWAAIGFVPLFSGAIVAQFPHLPITTAMTMMALSALLFLKTYKSRSLSASED